MLAFAAANQEEYELAYRTLNENLTFYQEIGSDHDAASTLHHLGLVAEFEGDYARAEGLYEQSLALQQHKDRDSIDPWVLHGLGFTSLCRGDYARARALLSQSTRMFQRSKYAMALARSLERFATLAVAEGEMERALRLMAAAERGRELIGSKMASGERRGYDEAVAVARAGLGSAQLVAIWCGGRAMTLEQAIEYALEKEDI
jgi:tetratricopeptide (TPR) repeat protein